MKLRILLLCFLFLTTSGGRLMAISSEKGIKIKSDKITLLAAIERISQEYEVYFTFDVTLVSDVEVEYEDKSYTSAKEAIAHILEGTNLKYKFYDHRFVILYREDAEGLESLRQMSRHLDGLISEGERTITSAPKREIRAIPTLSSKFLSREIQRIAFTVEGKVVDQEGEPLIGVNIQVKGSNKGTATDFDGTFSLEDIDENSVLVVSYVGYQTQEVPVAGKSALEIIMTSDSQLLDEIVVVGFGSMKKSDLTGSVVTADIESFKSTGNNSIAQFLQGTVPGLNVGITKSQGGEPGMSIRGLNTLGGATSPLIVLDDVIFRGRMIDINPNDILSITVLKDASAAAIYGSQAANGVILITTKNAQEESKPIISYSGNVGFQSPTKMWEPMNRAEFLLKNKDVWWRKAFTEESGYLEPNPNWNDLDAIVTADQVDGYINGVETDWAKEGIRTGVLNDHNISMQARQGDLSTFLSLGYTDSKGYVQGDNFTRISGRLNVDFNVLDWLNMGTQSFFTTSDYIGTSASLSGILTMSPLTMSYNEDGSMFLYPDGILTPLQYQERDDINKYNTLQGNFYTKIDIPFLSGLTYNINFTPHLRQRRINSHNPYANSEGGVAIKRYRDYFNWAFDHRINYNKSFGKNSIDFIIASGREKRTYDYTDASSGDFDKQGLSWNRLQDGAVDKQTTTSGGWQETSLYYLSRLVYNYSDRYILTGTIRKDGFSGFGDNNKFGLFPSVALGWRFTEEEMFKNKLSWLDYAKLRISYGKNGNRTVSRYQTLATMSSAYRYTFGGTSAIAQTTSSLPNPDLKWETTASYNLGMDYEILNSRISGYIDYYLAKTTDMLYEVSLPNIGGINSVFTNLGEIRNNGIEISLTSLNIYNRKFEWTSTLSFSRNRNEIVSILGKNNDGIEEDLVSDGLFIGEPVNSIYTYNVLGLYQIGDTDIPSNSGPGLYRYEDISGPDGTPDGVISPEFDRKIIGYRDPAYRWSLNNIFKYKNFSLMVFINSIQGGKKHYMGQIQGPSGSQRDDNVRRRNYGKGHEKYWWTPQNPDSPFKEVFSPDPVQEYRYFQRSFIRLQDVSLSYSMNKSVINRLNINELTFFVSGKNLYTWTDWLGLDPETEDGFMTSSPLLKNITVGVNLTF